MILIGSGMAIDFQIKLMVVFWILWVIPEAIDTWLNHKIRSIRIRESGVRVNAVIVGVRVASRKPRLAKLLYEYTWEGQGYRFEKTGSIDAKLGETMTILLDPLDPVQRITSL